MVKPASQKKVRAVLEVRRRYAEGSLKELGARRIYGARWRLERTGQIGPFLKLLHP